MIRDNAMTGYKSTVTDMKRWVKRLILLCTCILLTVIPACNRTGPDGADTSGQREDWNQAAEDELMRQVAEQELERNYAQYLPDELFAGADIFGIDWDGDQATAYARLLTAEYVALKGKAYDMSGSYGEAILRFDYDGRQTVLKAVEWPADGMDHEKWLKENFPAEYLDKSRNSSSDEPGENDVTRKMRKEVEERMGVPVETEDLLEINLDEETYEIVRIEEGIDDEGEYRFDFDTVDKGSLKVLSGE